MHACILDSLSSDGDGNPFALAHVMLEFGRQDQEAGHGTYAASLISEYVNTHNSLLNLTARTFTATMPGNIHYHIWQVLQLAPSPPFRLLYLSSVCCCSSTGSTTIRFVSLAINELRGHCTEATRTATSSLVTGTSNVCNGKCACAGSCGAGQASMVCIHVKGNRCLHITYV